MEPVTISGCHSVSCIPLKKLKFIVRLTDDDLPVLVGVGHLVSGSHLRVAGATYHEDDDARHVAHVLLRLVLVPLTVAATASRNKTNNQQRPLPAKNFCKNEQNFPRNGWSLISTWQERSG